MSRLLESRESGIQTNRSRRSISHSKNRFDNSNSIEGTTDITVNTGTKII
jgi:hypothetical protein